MSNQPSLRGLFNLAWPIVLARSTQVVIGLCDVFMVAPLGEEALAGASTGAQNTTAACVLPMGTVFILQSFTSQLRGRGELERVRGFAWYGLFFAALMGLLALVARPFLPGILGVFEYAPGVHSAITVYMSIRLLSVAAVIGTEALGNWYGGLENTRLQMVSSIVSMVVNVVACYLLIMPRFGLPGWGVAGAGWASVIASWCGFAVMFVPFLLRRGYERIESSAPLRAGEFFRMLRFGVPSGVNWFLEFSAFVVFLNVAIAHLGTTALAAMNVVVQINMIAAMPAFGLTSAGAIFVGEALGRRAHDEVWPIVRLAGGAVGAYMCVMGLAYLALPSLFLNPFLPEGPSTDFLRIGAAMLGICALWQLFDAVGMVLGEVLRAAGDTVWCMGARIVAGWCVFVPLAWLTSRVLDAGLTSVVSSMVVYLAVLAVALVWRFASGRWRRIDLVGGSTEPQLV